MDKINFKLNIIIILFLILILIIYFVYKLLYSITEKNHPQWSKTAIVGFVLSILWIYGLGSLSAIILGIISMRKINRGKGKLKGKGFSIASIILGSIGLVFPLWILISVIWTILLRLRGN